MSVLDKDVCTKFDTKIQYIGKTTNNNCKTAFSLDNGLFHFFDQSFAERFTESSILTETKDQPKSEVIFRLDSDSLSDSLGPNFELSDR